MKFPCRTLPVRIFIIEDFSPQFHISSFNKISCFGFEKRIFIADCNEFTIAFSSFISHTGQVWITFLTIAANNLAVVMRVLSEKLQNDHKLAIVFIFTLISLLQKSLRIVVGININLCQSIMRGWFNGSFVNSRLQPRQDQLETVSLFNLLYQFVSIKLTSNDLNQVFDNVFGAVHVK